MSDHESTYVPKTAFERWLDSRLPIIRFGADYMNLPTPKNLNYWWTFGGILTLCLMIQIVTGVCLAMSFTPNVGMAFNSVERIMRDVPSGWLLRYTHAVGATMFFVAVYIHMLRGLYYGSYKSPREMTWILGVVIFLLMIITAFLGYVLPWGQMSFWGATVITNVVGAIPGIGPMILKWLTGGPAIDNQTLNRFFSLHYLFPFLIFGVVVLHLWALHTTGQNNPVGILIPKERVKKDTVPFHPYYTVKDGFAVVLFLILFATLVFFAPNAVQDPNNYIPANPMQTPPDITPEWYLRPFYAMLRAIPDKTLGVVVMFASIGVLFILPWLNTSKVRSMRYRPAMRWFFIVFVIVGFGLGVCGSHPPSEPVLRGVALPDVGDGPLNSYLWLARFLTLYYFAFFFLIMPILGWTETPMPVPESIAIPVLSGGSGIVQGAAAQAEHKG
jgi:ubiquinol-cytochrome c reductase cytochrome b subunit